MNARLYDPVVGRFLSPDPYVQDATNSQNFNRYSYALNNPLKYVDLTGMGYTYNWDTGQYEDENGDEASWGEFVFWLNNGYTFDDWCFGNDLNSFFNNGGGTGGFGGGFSGFGGVGGYGNGYGGSRVNFTGSLSDMSYSVMNFVLYNPYHSFRCINMLLDRVMLGIEKTKQEEQYKFFWRLKNHYDNGTGEDFKINSNEFVYLIKRGIIDYKNVTDLGNGHYRANINFYSSGFDLHYSFGDAYIYYKVLSNGKNFIYDFNDTYDFDAKTQEQRNRSDWDERITRVYGEFSNGVPFNIYYKRFRK
jgi:hypothetical protein